jgi:hypothetical protein
LLGSQRVRRLDRGRCDDRRRRLRLLGRLHGAGPVHARPLRVHRGPLLEWHRHHLEHRHGADRPDARGAQLGRHRRGVIQVTNALYTGQAGGRLYDTDDVHAVAPTTINDVVCNAANYQDPSGPRLCGLLGSTSDAAVRGLARVDNEDSCHGDSGGTWYELVGNTRTGYGIHSRSNSGCHGDARGTRSWFTALPTAKAEFVPGYDVETR